MADFLVLRLVPKEPVSGTEFSDFIEDLHIQAFDVSFAEPNPTMPAPPPIGSAEWDDNPYLSDIVQHIDGGLPAPDGTANPPAPVIDPGDLFSVATALIEVTLPDPEFEQPDIILVLTRNFGEANAQEIARIRVDYNVVVHEATPSPTQGVFQTTFQDIVASDVAAYVQLRDPDLDGLAVLDLPEDGSPPSYTALRAAIALVMDEDPGPSPTTDAAIAAMTAVQARHVASEIIWNRNIEALPVPSQDLENLYTAPVSDSEETQRVRFEGAIAQYRAEHNGQAEVLAKYVFALATAIAARELSVAAERAALRVPVRPGEEPLGGKRQEVELTLRNP